MLLADIGVGQLQAMLAQTLAQLWQAVLQCLADIAIKAGKVGAQLLTFQGQADFNRAKFRRSDVDMGATDAPVQPAN